jgi:hypothetical protein
MHSTLDSEAFEALALEWLGGGSSAEQADQLWQILAEDPDRASQFAELARFESLLADALALKARMVAGVPTGETSRPSRRPSAAHGSAWKPIALGLAAALAMVSILGWQLEVGEGAAVRQQDLLASRNSDRPHVPVRPATHRPPPPVPASKPASERPAAERLNQRLDAFYLTGVALRQEPLDRALGLLQGQLRVLDQRGRMGDLRVIIPRNAATRRVSLTSGPISFLKAVQVLAALAGCDVATDEHHLSLVLREEIYPQPASQSSLLEVLAGRSSPDGRPAEQDEVTLAALREDAQRLGIELDPERSEGWNARLSKGQRTALLHLTEARQALALMPAPAYQLYVAEEAAAGSTAVVDQNLGEDEAKQLLDSGSFAGPVARFTAAPMISTPEAPMIRYRPAGEGLQLVVEAAGSPSGPAAETAVPGVSLMADQPVLLGSSATASLVESGILMPNPTGARQILLLVPVPPTPPNDP